MTYFPHTQNHDKACDCHYCKGIHPEQTIAREQERCIEQLVSSLHRPLDEKELSKIDGVIVRLSVLRRYFPDQKLPKNFSKLVEINKQL